MSYVLPKTRVGLVFTTSRSKIQPYWGNGYLSYLLRRGLGKPFLRAKYVCQKALSQVLWKPDDSHFWAGLMLTKKFLFGLGSFSIKDGSEIRFWEDTWLGNASLCEQYSALYSIVHHKGDTIVKVMETSPPVVTFRRDLSG
jgi:hypothetical protein